jgi:hypothetical protein
MTNVTLAKITRYVLRHACGDRCDRARPRTGAATPERPGVRLGPARGLAFFTPFIAAVFLPTLVAMAMLAIHARKTHSITLRPVIIALALLMLALLVSLAVNGPLNVEQLSCRDSGPPGPHDARLQQERRPLNPALRA